jgi:hypothetical protein
MVTNVSEERIASIFRTTNDFYPEDGGDEFLQDAGNNPENYMT